MAEGDGPRVALRQVRPVHLVEIRWFVLLALLGAVLFPDKVGVHLASAPWRYTAYLALGAMAVLNTAYTVCELRGGGTRSLVLPSLIADVGFLTILCHTTGGLASPIRGGLFLAAALAPAFLQLRPSLGVLALDGAAYSLYWAAAGPNSRGMPLLAALMAMAGMWGAGVAVAWALSMLPAREEAETQPEAGTPEADEEPQADEPAEETTTDVAGAEGRPEAAVAEDTGGPEESTQPSPSDAEAEEAPQAEPPRPAQPEAAAQQQAGPAGDELDPDTLSRLRAELDETKAKLEAIKSGKIQT